MRREEKFLQRAITHYLLPNDNLEFAAKEKLEIVSGAAHFDFAQYKPPLFCIFAGDFFGKV
jgi:hypothetical protein